MKTYPALALLSVHGRTARECRLAPVNQRREKRAMPSLERRSVTDAEKADGYIGALGGDIPFNTDSVEIRDRSLNRGQPFVEQVATDAFKRSLEEDTDIMGFAGHTDDPLKAFARIGKNLTITTDAQGMHYRALVPDTEAGRSLLTLVDKKIISGTSFEFNLRSKDGERWEKRGSQDIRIITDARLFTVNPVAFPAYLDSEITAERGQAREGERRGYYCYTDSDYSWGDPTLTCDTAYAIEAISRELAELVEAQEYLRSAPAGTLTDYAKAQVAESAAALTTLIAWFAANGGTANPDLMARAAQQLKETRTGDPAPAKPVSPNQPAGDRERRMRILKLAAPATS